MLNFTKDFKIGAILFSLFLIIITPLLYSTDFPNKRIKIIKLEINGLENQNEVKKLILIEEGDNLSLKKIRDSIKLIFKTGFYSDIKVKIKELKNKNEIELIFFLQRNLVIRDIKFQGIIPSELKNLKNEFRALHKGDFFSISKLNRACEEIKEIFKRRGFFLCRVYYNLIKNTKKSEIIILFNIKPGEQLMVKKIIFEGKTIFPIKILKAIMKTKEGKNYNPSILKKDIENLEKLFQEKKYYHSHIELGKEEINLKNKQIIIKIRINPGKKINFVIKGTKIPVSLLKPLWQEKVFEEWALTEGEAKILSFLRKKGYVFASVTSWLKKDKEKLTVFYQITTGRRYRPGKIIFHGVKNFTISQLQKKFKLKTKPLELWIDGNKLFDLPKKIENFYKSEGFSNAKITMNFQRLKNKLNVLIYIKEGERNIINQINFTGVKSFTKDYLLKQIKSFEGGPYYEPKVRADISRLEFFYLNNGFRGTNIKAEIDMKNKPNVSINFIIHEGNRVKIEKIIIIGNLITKRNIIQRELRVKEGDYAYRNKIIETKRRLEALGIFSEIKIEEIPINEKKENLMIRVREGKRNYIGFGAGLLTKREPYSFAAWNFEIMPRITLELSRSNIWGSASLFTFVTQVGPWEKRGVISWEQPYFFGLAFKSFINAWMEQEDRKSFDYNKKGISLTNIKQIKEKIIFLYRLRWTRTTLFNLEISESEVDKEHRPFSTSSIAGTLIVDKRDDPFNPERGTFFSLTSEWAYPLLGAEAKYFKNFIQFQNYIPLSPNLNFSSTMRIGLAWGRVPISERFFAGGSNSFRGERFDELGPKDPFSLKPIGGKALILFNFELKFPLIRPIKNLSCAIFYDNGNLFSKPREIKMSKLRNALGFGIRYKTPLGPIRIDFGIDLARKKIIPYLTIGNVI